MKSILLLALLPVLFCACATPRRPAPSSPALAAVVHKSSEAKTTVASARSDGKEVRQLHIESMSLVERLDYKATLLLKK